MDAEKKPSVLLLVGIRMGIKHVILCTRTPLLNYDGANHLTQVYLKNDQ